MEIQLLKKFADGANGNKLINKPPINTILAYASSVKGIKIKSFDKILISLN